MKTRSSMVANVSFLLTMFAFGVVNGSEPDSDGDGIPDAWESGQGLSPANPLDAGSDTDGDGLTALLEYALGGNVGTDDRGLLPEIFTVPEAGETKIETDINRRRDNEALVVLPQISTDLQSWSGDGLNLIGPPFRDVAGHEIASYRSTLDLEDAPQQFLRASVRVLRSLFTADLDSAANIAAAGGTTNLEPGEFVTGRSGQAAHVDGAGDFVQLPLDGPGNPRINLAHGELAFWFKPDVASNADATPRSLFTLSVMGGGSSSLSLVVSDRLTLALVAPPENRSVASNPADLLWLAGEWVHIRVAWDNAATDSLQVFVNGRRVDGGGAAPGWSLDAPGAPLHLFVGSADATGAQPAGGAIDDLSIRDHRQGWENVNTMPLIGSLGPLSTIYLPEETPLMFTLAASDPDGDELRFSLDAGAPAGASINAQTGQFAYTPPIGSAPEAHDFHLRVTDDGSPRMSRAVPLAIRVTGSTSPTVSNLTPGSQSAMPGDSPSVEFDYADSDGDIVGLRLSRTNVLGTQDPSVPAAFSLPAGTTSSHAVLPLDLSVLPYGITDYELTLVDARDNESTPIPFSLTLNPAAGGTGAPVATSFAPVGGKQWLLRPIGEFDTGYPRLRVQFTDADADAERFRIEVINPAAETSIVEIPVAGLNQAPVAGANTYSLYPVKFTATSPLGLYQFTVRVVDAQGQVGNALSTNVTLIDGGSPFFWSSQWTPYMPEVNYPDNGDEPGTDVSWDQEVTVAGYFDAEQAATVTINDLPCTVTSIGEFTMQVAIPEGAVSGPLVLILESGARAVSPVVEVRKQVRVRHRDEAVAGALDESGTEPPAEPEVVAVPAAGRHVLRAISSVPLDQSGTLTWRVNGIAGGNAAVGTVDGAGLYTAPSAVVAAFTAEVSAELDLDPENARDSVVLRIDPPTVPPGGGLVPAITGATVRAHDPRYELIVPPAALAADTSIGMTALGNDQIAALPDPGGGRSLLGAVVMEPDGLVFSAPVTLRLPLSSQLPPGSETDVLHRDGAGYIDEDIIGTVSPDGMSVIFQVNHFSTWVAATTPPAGPALPPAITALSPTSAEEGELLPVRFEGAAFGADLSVDFLRFNGVDWVATPVLRSRGLVVSSDGTRCGITLDIGTINDLDAEDPPEMFRIRLTREGYAPATADFTIQGLDEFRVANGETKIHSTQAPNDVQWRFSEVIVEAGGILQVPSGMLNFHSNGPVVVDGFIDAKGADGANGSARLGGPATTRGGRGGDGLLESPTRVGPIVVDDNVEPENFGQPGNEIDTSDRFPAGLGGNPGDALELDPVGLLADIATLFDPHNAVELFQQIETVTRGAASMVDLEGANPAGRRGLGAPLLATSEDGDNSIVDAIGGGGGGGAGSFEISFDLSDIASLLAIPLPDVGGFLFHVDGGGGGAGGDGGRSVRITSPRTIQVGGGIDTRGGDGGDGAYSSVAALDLVVLGLTAGNFGTWDPMPCFPGGGGGGGRGGSLYLLSSAGVHVASDASLEVKGGDGGEGGFTWIDPETAGLEYATGVSFLSNASSLGIDRSGPLFDPTLVFTRATDRRVVQFRHQGRLRANRFAGGGPLTYVTATVHRESIGTTHHEIHYNEETETYEGNVVLDEGFNVIATGSLPPVTILVISNDTDNDGLSDGDEADRGTDPDDPDTDGDDLLDGEEVSLLLNPLNRDTDGDGLGDFHEVDTGTTNPRAFDTDGDGFSDGAEHLLGSTPWDENSVPNAIPPNMLIAAVSGPDTGGVRLAVVDPDNDLMGLLGKPGGPLGFNFGVAADSFGELYVLSGSQLGIYNPFTDATTPVGTLSDGIMGGALAWCHSEARFYTMELGPSPGFEPTGQLVRIDPQTAAATRVGVPLSSAIHALACTWDGRLFAAIASPSNGDGLVEIDRATGNIIAPIGDTASGTLRGLAFTRDLRLLASGTPPAADGGLFELDQGTASATDLRGSQLVILDLTIMPLPVPAFEPQWEFDNSFTYTEKMLTGDFNDDGHLDIVNMVTFFGFYPAPGYSPIRLFAGDGVGGFTESALAALQWEPSSFDYPKSLDAGDLNGDGIPDLAAANSNAASPELVLLLSAKTGDDYSEHTEHFLAPPGTCRWVGIADLNPSVDDHPDLIVATATSLMVYFNNTGDGLTYTALNLGHAGPIPSALGIGDIDGDDIPDIVGPSFMYRNQGNGSFDALVSFPTIGSNGGTIVVADFNGDMHNDVMVTGGSNSGGIRVHPGNGTTTLPAPQVLPGHTGGGSDSDEAVAGDIDGNGVVDLVAGSYEGGYHAYFRPGGSNPRSIEISGDSRPLRVLVDALAVGDIDADGTPELVVADRGDVLIFRIGHPFKE